MLKTIRKIVRKSLPASMRHSLAMTRPNEPLLPILASRICGGTFIDIGANDGLFTHHLRGAADHVIAFEPVPALAEALRRRYREVEVHECALSDRSGKAPLFLPSLNTRDVLSRSSLNEDANPGFDLRTHMVEIKRLDDFAFKGVSAIKLDVEGHEEDVLKGAEATLRAEKPILVVEIEERHHPGRSKSILRWIESLGYQSFFHDGAGLMPAADFDFGRWQRPEDQKTAFSRASGAYVNNFIFLGL